MPPDEPNPLPSDAAESASSSPGSSTSDPFLGDAGPGFAPGADPGSPEAGPDLAPLIPEVSEEQVTSLLGNIGDGVHAVAGVGELDWVMTEADLARIGPPLTRIVNRHPELAALAAHSDEAAVAIGAGLYTWRSLLERQAVLRAQSNEPRAVKRERAPAPASNGGAPGAAPAPGPTIETPDDYVPAAERLRATRPPEAS
jgi:hypothetical protein